MKQLVRPTRYYRDPERYLQAEAQYFQHRRERDDRTRQAVEGGYSFGSISVTLFYVKPGTGVALVSATCTTCHANRLSGAVSMRGMARAAYNLARFHCVRNGHEQDVQAFANELERVKNLLYHNYQNRSWYSYSLTEAALGRFDRLDTIFIRTGPGYP